MKPLIAFLWLGIVCACGAETVTRDGVRYFIWKAQPEKVRVVWKDDGGKRLRDFPAAKAYIEGKGAKPLMLIRAF